MGELIIVGDRVLIDPVDHEQMTESGLVLPATVTEKDKIRSGRVVRAGPGYLTANPSIPRESPGPDRNKRYDIFPCRRRLVISHSFFAKKRWSSTTRSGSS